VVNDARESSPAPPGAPGGSGAPDGAARPLKSVDGFARTGLLPHLAWDREELWNGLFERAPLPYALYEIESRLVMANRPCAELFGYEHRPLAWFPGESLGHPDDKARTDLLLEQVARGERGPIEFEKRYRRADGTMFHAHVHASVVRDEGGGPWGVLLAFEDVTDRVAAEHARDESEQRLQALLTNASDTILIINDQGNITYASPSADKLIGEPVEPWIGKDVFRWAHPDDRPVGVEIFLATLANPGGVTGPIRIRLRRNDGIVRFVETIATNLIDDPVVGGIVLNVRDISDTGEVPSAPGVTQNRFRRMLENISDTVTLLDREGRIILTTGNLRPVMEYPIDFWDGLDGFALLHPADVEGAREIHERIVARPGSQYNGEVRIRQPDGSYRFVEIDAVNLLDVPDVAAIVLTARDVTDRNLAQSELAEARDRAVQALRERTEFIANVSHELRTPIHGILGLSELLATTDLDEDARTLARSIGRATDSLRMVLDDILDFSKIEVGRLETTAEPINVREMASDIDELFQPQARAKGITLTARIDPDFPENVRGDALRIRQVLHNLIGNAIKFTAEGTVHVSVRRVGGHLPMARISIRDTGIGISPESHDRLFEPFSQAYGDTGREYGGTGLGLAIARRLVELMGGELGFTSEPGRGSDFWFTLPLIEARPRPFSPVDRAGPMRATSERRVLVVEDNPINQLLVRSQLARLGYNPVVVASGDVALEAFPTLGADLVLMDWQLPGIDGLETTRRIRSWELANGQLRTPVVAMTASALPGDRDRCLAAGMDDFIAKPVSIGTLGATVRRWLGTADGDRVADPVVAPVPVGVGGGAGPGVVGDVDAPPPVVDPRALDVLTEELDDPALVATVVRTFLRELPGRVEWIVAACAAVDPVRLELMTHTLRSTSVAVGARQLALECERLERVARGNADGTGWDTTDLREAARAVADALGDQVVPPGNGAVLGGHYRPA
jgi:PAS domain S-box-containing protein